MGFEARVSYFEQAPTENAKIGEKKGIASEHFADSSIDSSLLLLLI